MKKFILLGLGFLFLTLGAIGLFLPVWPTTPFVLVAAGCFSTNPYLYSKIYKIKFFKEYLDCYHEGRKISTATRVKSLLWLWSMLLLSMFLVKSLHLTIFLSVVGLLVTIHILMIGRKKKTPKG